MEASIEYSDRYGGPQNWPDPASVCEGQCEGLGFYPIQDPDHGNPNGVRIGSEGADRREIAQAREEGRVSIDEGDGWVFVKCADCGGTGRRN